MNELSTLHNEIINSLSKKRTKRTTYCKKFRESHRDHMREYMNSYFKLWLEDPVNRRTHSIRTSILASVAHRKKGLPLRRVRKSIWGNETNYNRIMNFYMNTPKGHVVNHILTVRTFAIYEFLAGVNVPIWVICDEHNLEHISKEKNSSLGNLGDERANSVATYIEHRYDLPGLELLGRRTNNGLWWKHITRSATMEM